MEGLSVSDYMEKVIQKLHEEDMRARRYLHPRYYAFLFLFISMYNLCII